MPLSENDRTLAASDYDDFADAYSAENESNLFNAYYERPAISALPATSRAADPRRRVWLRAADGRAARPGRRVTGFDASPAMVDLARQRLGEDADLHVADLAAPLPFADAEFDDVVASLVLHYLEDWSGALAELRRVLKPGGRLMVSVNHPWPTRSSIPRRTTSRSRSTPRTTRSTGGDD